MQRSRIRDVIQLKSRLIEEWKHFHQVFVDEAGVHVFEFVFEHMEDILNTDYSYVTFTVTSARLL